jgi:AcrR family transcriptional regulator
VTQPYVFHFFRSKEELFKAVIDRAVNRIYQTFIGIEAPADQLSDTMGHAFLQILNAHRDEILMVMQAHAISEPAIREYVRERFRVINGAVIAKFERAEVSNAREAASQFMAMGYLITVSEVLDLPELLCFDPADEKCP